MRSPADVPERDFYRMAIRNRQGNSTLPNTSGAQLREVSAAEGKLQPIVVFWRLLG